MKMNAYWVYTHTTPDGYVYVGRSGQKYTCMRWQPAPYKSSSLWPYIERFGWDSITHEVIKDGLTKEESYKLEDELIRKYNAEGICINERCSGGLQCDGEWREYHRQHYQDNRDERLEYQHQYNQANRDQIYAKQKAWRAANREQYNAKQRARYAAKKQQKSPKSPSDGIAKKSQQTEYQYGDPLF